LLSLGGAQKWHSLSSERGYAILNHQQRALEGCRALIQQINSHAYSDVHLASNLISLPLEDKYQEVLDVWGNPSGRNLVLELLATSALLLLYEKLAGENLENGTSHIQSFNQLLPTRTVW
jgi:hypothetical protein